MPTEPVPLFTPEHLISVYTDEQAAEDGFKVDLTEWAREVGFTGRVWVTRGVWNRMIEWTDADTKRQVYQDTRGRAHDVLWMASLAARRNARDWFAEFYVLAVPRGGRATRPRKYRLWIVEGGGSVTIMFPEEY